MYEVTISKTSDKPTKKDLPEIVRDDDWPVIVDLLARLVRDPSVISVSLKTVREDEK